MDSLVTIPRRAAASIVFVRSQVAAEHPSAALLGEERLGVGVAVEPNAVLTAHYLVLGASQVSVTGLDGQDRPVRRSSLDHDSGLALLGLEGEPLHPARLGRSQDVRPGLPVFLLTCTGERERKGATGHVASVGPFEAFWEYMLDRAIMTTAINPGLAGAPLFDPEARLVGIVSLGLAAVARYSLAIPLDLYIGRRQALFAETPPVPRRAWIGFFPQASEGGVLISGVVANGPADRAGISRGDLVLSVNGRSVTSLRDLYGEVWRKGPGETVSLQVLRDSSIRIVEVVAGDRYEFYR